MAIPIRKLVNESDVEPIEALDGIFRQTLTYSNSQMLCKFDMKKGAQIPLHNHEAAQVGYVISGKVKFITEGEGFEVSAGHSYAFDSMEKHGATIIEDTNIIEVFDPVRPEYIP